jgi:hypothetical protein
VELNFSGVTNYLSSFYAGDDFGIHMLEGSSVPTTDLRARPTIGLQPDE